MTTHLGKLLVCSIPLCDYGLKISSPNHLSPKSVCVSVLSHRNLFLFSCYYVKSSADVSWFSIVHFLAYLGITALFHFSQMSATKPPISHLFPTYLFFSYLDWSSRIPAPLTAVRISLCTSFLYILSHFCRYPC